MTSQEIRQPAQPDRADIRHLPKALGALSRAALIYAHFHTAGYLPPSQGTPQLDPLCQYSEERSGPLCQGIDIAGGGCPSANQVFRMELDGSGRRQLTFDGYMNDEPSVSGDTIAFNTIPDVSSGEFVGIMALDGSGKKAVTEADSYGPDILNDELVFDKPIPFAKGTDIFTMSLAVENGSATNVTNTPNLPDWDPAFSPDGKQIAFVSLPVYKTNIFVYDVTSRRVRQLTDFTYAVQPAFSPDGAQIVFAGFAGSGSGQEPTIYIVPAAGGAAVAVPNLTGYNASPIWGENGKIVYTHVPKGGGHAEIWMVNPDGADNHFVGPGHEPTFARDPSTGEYYIVFADSIPVSDQTPTATTVIPTPTDTAPTQPTTTPVVPPDAMNHVLYLALIQDLKERTVLLPLVNNVTNNCPTELLITEPVAIEGNIGQKTWQEGASVCINIPKGYELVVSGKDSKDGRVTNVSVNDGYTIAINGISQPPETFNYGDVVITKSPIYYSVPPGDNQVLLSFFNILDPGAGTGTGVKISAQPSISPESMDRAKQMAYGGAMQRRLTDLHNMKGWGDIFDDRKRKQAF